MNRYPYGETLTWHSRVKSDTPDSDGNDVYVITDTTLTNVPVWPRDGNGTSSNEKTSARDQVIVGYAALLPADLTLTAQDTATWRGLLFEVDGEPGYLSSPFTGWKPGITVALRRVTG